MARKKVRPVGLNVNTRKHEKTKSHSTIKPIPLNTSPNEELLIDKILLGTTMNYPPEKWLKCRVSFICIANEVDRIHLEFDEISVIVSLIINTDLLKEIFTANVFSFQFPKKGEDLFIKVYFRQLPLPKFNSKIGNSLKTLFEITHKIYIEYPLQEAEENKEEFDLFYKRLSSFRKIRKKINLDNIQNIQHPSLKPTLRPYQISAVKWMLSRELNSGCIEDEKDNLHPLFTLVELPTGIKLYFDKFSGYITPAKPVVSSPPRGGILAEEMGLGKTVEFLALILNNPFVNENAGNLELSVPITDNSSDELSDNDNVDMPVFKRQKKKVNFKKKIKPSPKDDKMVDYVAKDIKVPENWVKKSKHKSNTRAALQLWYNKALSEVNAKPKPEPLENIECICGETYKSGQTKCVNCGKYQHKDCVGYEKSLGQFRCSTCWLEQPLIESGATLIVTPISLRTQWCNEIKKHVDKKLRVLVYEGSNKIPVYPTYFKRFDLVITTYNVLQAEFRITEKGQVCELRRKRKYDFQGSPLTRIKWWRLCLDEAQTVETPGKIVSEMSKKLTAHYRWAITGTPISKNISDIFGLVTYLQMEPYNELDTWNNILYSPYCNGEFTPLCLFLSEIMWRSTKAEVINQIGIPEQIVREHFLEFSAVEKFFYNKEHELCSQAFIHTLARIDINIPLVKLDRGLLKKIMLPLISLRQVCTHPNSERGKYLATKRKVSTMKELLEALILKNSTESEEQLRVVVSALNGLSGIHLLMQNPIQAAEDYREVLQLSARFSEQETMNNLTVDKLQLIHTMHNLAELIDKYPFVPPTLHDASLRADCSNLEQKYIQKFISNTFSAYQEYINAQLAAKQLQDQFTLREGQWYSDGIDWVLIENLSEELTSRIKAIHDTFHIKCPIDITCERTILLFVTKWYEELLDYRADLINTIDSLFTYKRNEDYKIFVKRDLVDHATDCHLRPDKKCRGKKKKKCLLCIAEDYLKKYEDKIYKKAKTSITYGDMCLKGTWKATSEELTLKSLSILLKAKNAPEALIKDSENHLNLIENLKKEFKEMRKLWTHIYQQVAAQDELDMCKTKLMLEDPDEEKNKPTNAALKKLSYIIENKLDTLYMLNENELEHHMMLLKSDKACAMTNLEKNLGVKSYLETLRKQQYEGASPDPCPICTNVLDHHWSILPCGHSYCMECIHKLLKTNGSSFVTCCVCRQIQAIQDISCIRSAAITVETSDLNIKGNYSTKIEATIKLIMELREVEEDVKVLVFSTWISILKTLKDALLKNEIKSEILLTSKLEERIEYFKDEKEKVTALLLPINLGGKGLNLIEATHVILMEPLLNPGDELQAIGRVHRIGQTKPTFVHKFCIKNTIEESILTATSTDTEKWDRSKVTLGQLKNLFEKVEMSDTSGSGEHNDDSMSGNINNEVVVNSIVNVSPDNTHPE